MVRIEGPPAPSGSAWSPAISLRGFSSYARYRAEWLSEDCMSASIERRFEKSACIFHPSTRAREIQMGKGELIASGGRPGVGRTNTGIQGSRTFFMNNPRQVWREERYQAEESNLVVHFSAMPESNGGSSPHCKLAMASEPESVEHLM